MNKLPFFKILVLFVIICSCKAQDNSGHAITIENTLDIPRTLETVEINKSDLKLEEGERFEKLSILDSETKAVLVSQFIDENQDGKMDVLLFQPEIDANSKKQFVLTEVESSIKPEVLNYCYSRFVPERTDDYAWENDKVAFRTFGPVAQKMIEDGVKGGTLSSGIDAWLKRVETPIINKWYKRNDEKKGAYHQDIGDGLDNFHVGISRGVGGIAVKKDTTYYISKNFTSWKTTSTGPLRTSFVLEYADWDANGQAISETKHISLDRGSNLSRFEIELTGIDAIHVGLTLHEKDGVDTQNSDLGYISYWQPHDDSELGTAIVVPNKNMISSNLFDTSLKDWSNLYAEIKVNNGKAIYYSGFGWKKAGEFTSKETWENYLKDFILKINNPLLITFK